MPTIFNFILDYFSVMSVLDVNPIKSRADVEMSDGPGKPYFGHIDAFVAWLKEHSDKNWAEWNTRIYRMSDLKAGRMPDDMPATTGDLFA